MVGCVTIRLGINLNPLEKVPALRFPVTGKILTGVRARTG
jgi:hypothetical protein